MLTSTYTRVAQVADPQVSTVVTHPFKKGRHREVHRGIMYWLGPPFWPAAGRPKLRGAGPRLGVLV